MKVRKIWSIILSCLSVLAFLFIVGFYFYTKTTLAKLKMNMTETVLPGAYILAYILGGASLQLSLFIYGSFAALIGFAASLVNMKLAPGLVVKRISIVFLCLFSAMILAAVGIVIYFIISLTVA